MLKMEEAKEYFKSYVKNFDINEKQIIGKYEHTFRVMEISKNIAESIGLNEEQIEIATFIALFHDISRFEQYTKYKTFNDLVSFDHGDYAVEILEKSNILEEFSADGKVKDIIKKAIKNHNKFRIDSSLNEEEQIYAKIIRDADKLDILYLTMIMYFIAEDRKEKIENGIILENVMEHFRNREDILKTKDFKEIDSFLIYLGFTFDFNYKYSFEVLKKEDYINKIIDNFDFKNEETCKNINEIKNIINEYIYNK